MAWVAPPTFIAGTIFTAANANALSGDLTLLTNSLQFVAQGGGIAGSPPSTGAPNFQQQFGVSTGVTNGTGNFTVTFPVAFPNGLLGALATNYGTTNHFWVELSGSPTRSAATFTCLTSSSSTLNGGAYDVVWLAQGF